MYTLAYSIQATIGLTLSARFRSLQGVVTGGSGIYSAFTAGDWYGFTINTPDEFQGYTEFVDEDGNTVALFAVNPQELENADVKTSSISPAGLGSVVTTLTVQSTANQPVPMCSVWITTDSAGRNVVAGALPTNVNGQVVFLLDPGNYFIWRRHPSVAFENPKILTVTALP